MGDLGRERPDDDGLFRVDGVGGTLLNIPAKLGRNVSRSPSVVCQDSMGM